MLWALTIRLPRRSLMVPAKQKSFWHSKGSPGGVTFTISMPLTDADADFTTLE
jgi:hypothetical protein